MRRTSQQACLLCPWARHLTGCLRVYVADKWWSQAVYPSWWPSLTKDMQTKLELIRVNESLALVKSAMTLKKYPFPVSLQNLWYECTVWASNGNSDVDLCLSSSMYNRNIFFGLYFHTGGNKAGLVRILPPQSARSCAPSFVTPTSFRQSFYLLTPTSFSILE